MLWIGALYLAASGPLMAQTMGLNASTSLSEPCSSAKAVHDMRCPNYTGFKPRVGGGAAPAAASDDALGLAVPERPALGLRGGRDWSSDVQWAARADDVLSWLCAVSYRHFTPPTNLPVQTSGGAVL